ncbi:MAG: dinitrogenase iron-molybdenum cofactor biosynthesis protein [Oscillospiraceae bacterium]|nr:dinitrogenase iron-molybdenum cofactor biosynthesis protein [Oscillospiraceae bacterium]
MKFRVAVASTDGIVINQHFGHAEKFHIAELNTEDLSRQYLESRTVKRACQGHEHSEQSFDAILETLSDVQAILVAKIGQGASDYLESHGMLVYESPFLIDAVLEKILKDKIWEVDAWQSHMKN